MNKLEGIKEGDRVKVTFEATLGSKTGRFTDVLGQRADVCFSPAAMEDPTFQIECVERQIQVGDMVTWDDTRIQEVVAIRGELAVLWAPNGVGAYYPTAQPIRILRKAPSTPVREEG